MDIFETIGLIWVVFTSCLATVGLAWLAWRGVRSVVVWVPKKEASLGQVGVGDVDRLTQEILKRSYIG